ncbi:hypothetical protein CesoFtcFv8_007149 [Champsocephalus esox]|uniref:Uncharacterized protein n=1 Tax=Champsocephalus esox TaxID=159716 RepID=A0AAN8CDN6_9TELE|nr:hypothetical protein CesoFtcFv8_007149 [Champsocephalus esox]
MGIVFPSQEVADQIRLLKTIQLRMELPAQRKVSTNPDTTCWNCSKREHISSTLMSTISSNLLELWAASSTGPGKRPR